MNFTDRETYIQARTEWKANYKRISQAIRDARGVHRVAARTATPFWVTAFGPGTAKEKYEEYRAVTKAEAEAWRNLLKLRREAREALDELAVAKVEANRQWELSKNVVKL